MAGWISSKLKVAETLLQQIDQQAAESLGKNEKPPSPSAETATQIPQKLDSALPLKYQLPKRSPPVPPSPRADQTRQTPLPDAAKPSSAPSSSTHPDPAGIDWTELLSSPNRVSPAASPNGVRKKVKKPAIQAAVRPVESGKVEDKPQGQSEKDEELQSFPIEKVELLGNSSESEGSSGSEPEGSDSGSDSEEERKRREERRKKREQMIAEKRAAAAVRAIKEREDSVARLEGEKESLEKMLEEKEKQQAQEVSELQTSMIKNMEAVELEKQKHNYTRMEALTRLAKLE